MKAPKIFRYLWRDKVDLIILLLTVMFGVLGMTSYFRNQHTQEGNFSYWIVLLILYIIGAIVRIGIMLDVMNSSIKDPEIRRTLSLDHKESKGDKIAGAIFFGIFLTMYVAIFITLYNKI